MFNLGTYNTKSFNAFLTIVAPAYINITSVTRYAISAVLGFDVSTVKFTSDIFLAEWVARAAGTDHATGTLVGSGGSLTAGNEGFFVVEHDEIVNLGDGTHRINVYGKNEAGVWSEYEQ